MESRDAAGGMWPWPIPTSVPVIGAPKSPRNFSAPLNAEASSADVFGRDRSELHHAPSHASILLLAGSCRGPIGRQLLDDPEYGSEDRAARSQRISAPESSRPWPGQ